MVNIEKEKNADRPTNQVKPWIGNAKQTFFFKLGPTSFDSITNFLRIVSSSHCLWDKGRFAKPKKGVLPRL